MEALLTAGISMIAPFAAHWRDGGTVGIVVRLHADFNAEDAEDTESRNG